MLFTLELFQNMPKTKKVYRYIQIFSLFYPHTFLLKNSEAYVSHEMSSLIFSEEM